DAVPPAAQTETTSTGTVTTPGNQPPVNVEDTVGTASTTTTAAPGSTEKTAAGTDRPSTSQVDAAIAAGATTATDTPDSSAEATAPEVKAWDLDTKIDAGDPAPTARQVLERYAGPGGLTAEQMKADEDYCAAHGDEK